MAVYDAVVFVRTKLHFNSLQFIPVTDQFDHISDLSVYIYYDLSSNSCLNSKNKDIPIK